MNKRCKKEDMLLYAVTDRKWEGKKSLYEQVREAIEGGVTCVQLREKNVSYEEFLKEALEIKKLCNEARVPFIVNDNVQVAIQSGADGVHIGQGDMDAKEVRKKLGKDMIMGVSVQNVEQAVKAMEDGADYLGVGAVFATDTKKDAVDVSYEMLKKICEKSDVPVVAIGGINEHNIAGLSGSGVDGVAVISAIFSKDDIKESCIELRKQSEYMTGRKMYTALTIAGSDCSGGAGIQADIKTMLQNGVYAMSAVTALTAQNTTGVREILEVDEAFLASQIDAIFEDIYPDAVKIGMVSNEKLIDVIAEKLKFYNAKNIVIDPVMVATSGATLSKNTAVERMKEKLLGLATVVTPNILEAEVLSGIKIEDEQAMLKGAEIIGKKYGCAVLLKGGHSINDANDLLYKDGEYIWFYGRRIENDNTHGTGCTLSSAIASYLARGFELEEAIGKSKEYISGALNAMLDLGKGSGPMNHGYILNGKV